jgi:hypothetical protein
MEQIEINVTKNIENVEINVEPNVTQVIISEVNGGGGIQSVQAGTNVTVDNTDPQNPVINVPNIPSGGVESVTGNIVDNTDPANPTIDFTAGDYDLADFTNESSDPFVRESELPSVTPNIEQVLAQGNYDGVHGFASREYVGSFTEDPDSGLPYVGVFLLNDNLIFGTFDPEGSSNDLSVSADFVEGKLKIFSNSIPLEENLATEEWVLANAPSGAVDSVNGQTGVVVLDASDIGLGNVDNTSDLDKPISTATQTELNDRTDNVVSCKAYLPATPVAGQGSTVWVEIYKRQIPANTFPDLSEISVESIVKKFGTTAVSFLGIFAKSGSDDFSTAIEIGSSGGWGATSNRLNIRREFVRRGTIIEGITTVFANPTDEFSSLTANTSNQFLNYSIDLTQNTWIYIAVRGNAADTFQKTLFEVKRTLNKS